HVRGQNEEWSVSAESVVFCMRLTIRSRGRVITWWPRSLKYVATWERMVFWRWVCGTHNTLPVGRLFAIGWLNDDQLVRPPVKGNFSESCLVIVGIHAENTQ